jgi:hypothetical protein
MMCHTCNPSSSGGRDRRITNLRPAWAKLARSCLRNTAQHKRKWGVTQVVEHLPSMCEALDSIPSTIKKKKKKRKMLCLFKRMRIWNKYLLRSLPSGFIILSYSDANEEYQRY